MSDKLYYRDNYGKLYGVDRGNRYEMEAARENIKEIEKNGGSVNCMDGSVNIIKNY